MAIKRVPEDFQVDELADVQLGRGPFACYRLSKRWLGTPEAVTEILDRWNLSRQQLSYGGLKDFHAVTSQFVTIHRGPRAGMRSERFELEYLGQTEQAFTPRDIVANRFLIVLRELPPERTARLETELGLLRREGVPNYFDEQRFGSVGESGEFIAKPWCLGNYERALWLALADPNEHDARRDADEKEVLREHWGRWSACQTQLPRSHRRNIVSFLAEHPTDFRRAISLLRVDLRSLYLAAFQSYLWNRMLVAFLRESCPPESLGELRHRFGPVPYPRGVDEETFKVLAAAFLPLPSARWKPEGSPHGELVERVLLAEGIQRRELRVKYPRDSFFSRGDRAAVVFPAKLEHATDLDERNAGFAKFRLVFELPRGSYATLLIARLTTAAEQEPT